MKVEVLYAGWDEIHEMSYRLGLMALEDGYYPDVIVGVLRGGYIVARILSDVLGLSDIGVVEVKFYKGVGEQAKRPVITQPLTAEIRGRKVLIVDDVVDSGRTLEVVSEQVRLRGATEVRTASLYYKPRSIIKPDYYVVETSKWVLFPWELGEFVKELLPKEGLEVNEGNIKEFLRSLGIEVKEEVLKVLAISIELSAKMA